MKQTLLIGFCGLLALAAGIAFRSQGGFNAAATAEKMILDFSFVDLQGTPRNIQEWQGKVIIINFWATWCPPCLKEIPDFIQIQKQLKTKNVQFIGIALDEADDVKAFVKNTPINYPILLAGDEGMFLSRQLGNVVGAVPFTVVVNSQGQIVYRHPGELAQHKLLEILKPFI